MVGHAAVLRGFRSKPSIRLTCLLVLQAGIGISLVALALPGLAPGFVPRSDLKTFLVGLPDALAAPHFIVFLAVTIAFGAAICVRTTILDEDAFALATLVSRAALHRPD